MLEILKNPKTENFNLLKKTIFNHEFPWYFQETSTTGLGDIEGHENHPFYSHILLTRPDTGACYTESKSNLTELGVAVVTEILKFNNKKARFFFTRISINSTFPIEGNQITMPHYDHDFAHINFICYLTDDHGGGGRTFIKGHEPYKPVEDECIVFSGRHYMELPKKGRRVIIVATMITY
tara:strand:- start:62 stop:601 length:540 start_codon:yes stop_codon:yes gene_type:complete